MQNPSRLFIFDTHPIQYRAPVFRDLHQRGVDLQVFYFSDRFDGKKWWFGEVGKIPKQVWNVPLLDGYPSIVLKRKWGLLSFFLSIKKLFSHQPPTGAVIYGWYLPEHWILWALCDWYRVPLIFVGETFETGSASWRKSLKKVLHPLFFKKVSQVISIGNKTHDFYRHLRIPEERITRAKYCVDTSFFQMPGHEAKEVRRRIRDKYKIPHNAFVVLFVGRLFERKRPSDLILIHKLLDRYPNFYTLIVGNGPQEEYLKHLAQGESKIIFAGFKDQNETKEMYHASDVFVMPSEFETWGLVINEAFAAGIPAVVTHRCGAANDLVEPGETGYVYPVGQVQEAARCIGLLVDNSTLRAEMGKKAQSRVVDQYGISQFASALQTALGAC